MHWRSELCGLGSTKDLSLEPTIEHRPSLGNHEGEWPSNLLDDPEALAAIDALRPDRQAPIEARLAEQR